MKILYVLLALELNASLPEAQSKQDACLHTVAFSVGFASRVNELH